MTRFWDFWREGTKASTMRLMMVIATLNVFLITIIRCIKGDEIDWYGLAAFMGVFVLGKVSQKIWGENVPCNDKPGDVVVD